MKRAFLYFANWNGRIIKCVIGFLLMIAGLYPSIYPLNVVALIAGAIVFAAGAGNVLILAPLFGFPMSGKRMRELYGHSHSSRLQEEAQAPIRRDPGKTNSGMINAEVNTGSTTQGGSNFGQGSSYLAHDAQHQGKEKNRGASYDNESGQLDE